MYTYTLYNLHVSVVYRHALLTVDVFAFVHCILFGLQVGVRHTGWGFISGSTSCDHAACPK